MATTDWFSDPSGLRVLDAERLWVERQLATVCRNDFLQIGGPSDDSFIEKSRVMRAFFLAAAPPFSLKTPSIQSRVDALPVRSNTMDIVLSLHTLENVSAIEPAIADIYRVLKPEGVTLITGFQRFGLWRLWDRFLSQALFPKNIHFYSVDYITHILQAQGFVVESQQTACFRLPSQKKGWLFLETLGQLLLPYHGAVYMITATKKELGITPLFEPLFVKKISTRVCNT
ncbi:MAG: methyltransferase domain-containing protein [Coxiellaceae bacterium]|nr:methyltransferase domain-containing protein [Coxiellaceae bacterium]